MLVYTASNAICIIVCMRQICLVTIEKSHTRARSSWPVTRGFVRGQVCIDVYTVNTILWPAQMREEMEMKRRNELRDKTRRFPTVKFML